MSDYIEREEAEERLLHMAEVANSAYDGLYNSQIVMLAQNMIHMLPAADVRPVVLCRDCQYCHTDRAGNIGCFHCLHYQTNWGGKIQPNDYCSLGRKREES